MPSHAEMVEWIFFVAPDFRRQHPRPDLSAARFTYAGEVFEVVARGERAREDVVQEAYRVLREATGHPLEKPRNRELEQQIVAARFRGEHAAADAFELELVQLNAGGASVRRRPAPVRNDHGIRAPFGQRPAW